MQGLVLPDVSMSYETAGIVLLVIARIIYHHFDIYVGVLSAIIFVLHYRIPFIQTVWIV